MSGTIPPGFGQRLTLLAPTTIAVATALTNPLLTYDGAGVVTVPAGIIMGLQRYSAALVMLRVTAAATLVGDTLNVLVDTVFSPKARAGSVARDWVNAIQFAQVLGNGGVKAFVAAINNQGGTMAAPLDVTADVAVATVRPLVLGDGLRVRYVTVGTGSFTFQLDAYVQ